MRLRTIAIHRSIGAQAHPTPFWFHYDYHEKFTIYFARVLRLSTPTISNRHAGRVNPQQDALSLVKLLHDEGKSAFLVHRALDKLNALRLPAFAA